MCKMIIGLVVICCVMTSSMAFAAPVPSEGMPQEQSSETLPGGRSMSDSELVLMVVGIVCGTILLLSILD